MCKNKLLAKIHVPEMLSVEHARKLVLHSQQLPPRKRQGRAIEATLAAIEHLSYIQIDTISVIQRAHHHTLWNRNPRYQPAQLDQLVASKQVFEYWSHAAAYLPMRDYRFSLYRKCAIRTGALNHWHARDAGIMKMVLERITVEGPLMARDFEHSGGKTGEWESKPAKQALESLFMQGDLMISRRDKFHKVYDLSERVLPSGLNQTLPTDEEYARFLIKRFLNANGIALAGEFTYLLKNIKLQLLKTLQQMLADGELKQICVAGVEYYVLPQSLALLDKPLARNALKILSPFDNLLIQRKRMSALFGFDYQIECYVPANKRKYGYFVLPILWDGQLLARMDCKANRRTETLHVLNLVMEPGMKKQEAFSLALIKELKTFMRFNGTRAVVLNQVSCAAMKPLLQAGFK